MLSIFDSLRAVTMASITLRMLLSVLCGGLIGIEREYKRRPAGFRTHILICLGAAMVSLTSQFLFLNMHYYLDVSRMSASVTAGIGFIGAGSIIVTRQQRVKGLTTAAGLWAAAIIGLAVGSGFYEGALLATVLVLLAEAFLSKLEYWMMDHAPEINLYMEYEARTAMDASFCGPTASPYRIWRSPAPPAARTIVPAPFSLCASTGAFPWTSY